MMKPFDNYEEVTLDVDLDEKPSGELVLVTDETIIDIDTESSDMKTKLIPKIAGKKIIGCVKCVGISLLIVTVVVFGFFMVVKLYTKDSHSS